MLAEMAQPGGPGLTWPEIAGGVAAVLVALSIAMAAGAWWVRHVAHREAAPARQAAHQLATSNGHTAGELLESTAATVQQLKQIADANRVRIDALDARLDRHIVSGHRSE